MKLCSNCCCFSIRIIQIHFKLIQISQCVTMHKIFFVQNSYIYHLLGLSLTSMFFFFRAFPCILCERKRNVYGGGGGDRTRVQKTGNLLTYMLSYRFVSAPVKTIIRPSGAQPIVLGKGYRHTPCSVPTVTMPALTPRIRVRKTLAEIKQLRVSYRLQLICFCHHL